MIHMDRQADYSVLNLTGRLDGLTMGEVEKCFLEAVAAGEQRFVFDMEQLEYISSAGLRVMLLAMKKTKAIGGQLVLCGLSGMVEEVFQMSGFTAVFSIAASRQEAIQNVRIASGE